MKATVIFALLMLLVVLVSTPPAHTGAFVFTSGTAPELIAHPTTYLGNGGDINVRVCIAPGSESITEMQVAAQNSVTIWNRQQAASPNIFLGGNNDIPVGAVDFESPLTHELDHRIGLAHPNEATESGLPVADRDYTKTAPGPNGVRDLDPGSDGIRGSADDLRGDDINLHWFNIVQQQPVCADRAGGCQHLQS